MSTSVPPSRRQRNPRRSIARQHPPLSEPGSQQTAHSRATRSRVHPTHQRRSPQRRFPPAPPKVLVRPSRFRLVLVWGVLMVGSLLLALNLFRLQVIEAPLLQERAQAQQMVYLRPYVPRRPIVDREGSVLAIDQPVYTLYAHPVLFSAPQHEIANALAPLLDRTPSEVMTKFGDGDSGIRIADDITEDMSNEIRKLQVDGLELIEQQKRLYPQQDLFASVVGYVNVDRAGQTGIESSREKQLEHPISEVKLRRAGDGSIIPDGIPDSFLHQDDLKLQLTLDSRLQRATRYALVQQMEQYSAKRGAIMVMDVQDGSLLAFVSEPSFDPNQYYDFDLERLGNWAISDLYEPGSTFKPINIAIALETESIQPDDVFPDEGWIEVGGWPIQNSDYEEKGGRGSLSVTGVLKHSSNVGMVHVMSQVKPDIYYQWLERLGLGKPTGIDLPSEGAGQMKTLEQFTSAAIEPATTAFGQGFSLTPVQLLQLHGMLANGGKMITPHVTRGLVDTNGTLQWQPDLPQSPQIFSPATAKTVLSMMEVAVQEGTGKDARIAGYRIGGKTGTAQKATDGGYSNARITSFVGTFPVEAPRYTVLVVIDEPQGENAYGSTVAAPIAKSVLESLIAIEQIPPSQPATVDEADRSSDEQVTVEPIGDATTDSESIAPTDSEATDPDAPVDSFLDDLPSEPESELPVDDSGDSDGIEQ